jgi:cation transport ATPase
VKQTTSAIKELSAIQNLTAKRENKDGTIQSISFKDINPKDILLVNSGDKIPTDGIIILVKGTLMNP